MLIIDLLMKFTLPLHTKLSDEDVDYVIENFKEIVSMLVKRVEMN